MTKAEELAIAEYPICEILSISNINYNRRVGFIEGFKRGQRSALTWEDVQKIVQIENELWMEIMQASEKEPLDKSEDVIDQDYYEEILKRFNKEK